ncbi:hypothetical protein V493_00891 [Pseudogymnoascus sp. VKM F-4281 (FW-2241)]|nr:hypothetical protein V493_00891 [Pseudogymnoascus sp. VKM F-4281 (FW-2241)]
MSHGSIAAVANANANAIGVSYHCNCCLLTTTSERRTRLRGGYTHSGCATRKGLDSHTTGYIFDSLFSSPTPPNNTCDGVPHAPSCPPGRRGSAGSADRFHAEQWTPDFGGGGIPDGLRDASCAAEGLCFLVAFTLACIGTLIFQCIPVRAAWDFQLRPHAKCFSNDTFMAIGLFNGAVNIATDVAFALLPIPIIWKLSVNLRTKISLIFILSLGFMACVAAIVREVLLSTYFKQVEPTFHNEYALWNYAELSVGVIAACLPALRPLFAFLLDKASSTFASGQPGLSTRRKYYMQSNDINLSSVGKNGDSEGQRGDGRYGVTVSSNGRDFYEDRMPRRPMGKLEQSLTGDSDENILPIQDVDVNGRGNNRIVKTTEGYWRQDVTWGRLEGGTEERRANSWPVVGEPWPWCLGQGMTKLEQDGGPGRIGSQGPPDRTGMAAVRAVGVRARAAPADQFPLGPGS